MQIENRRWYIDRCGDRTAEVDAASLIPVDSGIQKLQPLDASVLKEESRVSELEVGVIVTGTV